jgi:hypothetical protein
VALLVTLTLLAPTLTASDPTLTASTESMEGRARAWTLVAVVIAVAVLVTWRAWRVRVNYRTVASVLPEPEPDAPSGAHLLVDARHQADLRSWWHLAVATAMLVVVLAASVGLLLWTSRAWINTLPATAYLLLLATLAAAPCSSRPRRGESKTTAARVRPPNPRWVGRLFQQRSPSQRVSDCVVSVLPRPHDLRPRLWTEEH